LLLAIVGLIVMGALLFVGMLLFAVGRERDTELLDPAFRKPALTLLAKAEKATGGGYEIGETARPAWRQDALYELSRIPFVTLTKVPSARACHVTKAAWDGARAMDVVATGDSEQRHAFYLYLKEHAARHGLRSGGTFGKPGSGELGWDPGHIELPGCTKG
jgi:hypothetical protein